MSTSERPSLAALAAVSLIAASIFAGSYFLPRDPAYDPENSVVDVRAGGICSGVAVGPNLVITAAHCVGGIDKVTLTTRYGPVDKEATVLWRGGLPKGVDLALLKTSLTLQPAKIDCKITVKIGDEAQTVGSPDGLTWTHTRVWIAALNRKAADISQELDGYADTTQFSGGIAGGQSGGALFSLTGYLLGVTTLGSPMTTAGNGKFALYGYAIPISTVCATLGRQVS